VEVPQHFNTGPPPPDDSNTVDMV